MYLFTPRCRFEQRNKAKEKGSEGTKKKQKVQSSGFNAAVRIIAALRTLGPWVTEVVVLAVLQQALRQAVRSGCLLYKRQMRFDCASGEDNYSTAETIRLQCIYWIVYCRVFIVVSFV